jgi:hypothetical protein
MAAGLFESSSRGDPAARPPTDEPNQYQALASTAIAAIVLGLLSPLAFVDWWLAVVPILGFVLGLVAIRDIAGRPAVLTGRPLAIAAMILSTLSLVGGLAYLSAVYAAELPEGFSRLTFASLQPLPGDPADAIPDSAREMDGRDVLLKGYMYPGKQQTGISQFLLVRDQGDCCFGGNPKITDRVLVQLRDPKGIPFSPRLTKIAGRFAIRPTGIPALDGGVLYHLEDARVR